VITILADKDFICNTDIKKRKQTSERIIEKKENMGNERKV
jgi:hypothetical protein